MQCVKFTGSDISEANRKIYYQIFSVQGAISRIYIDKSFQFGYIHYNEPNVCKEALKKLQNLRPFNFKYSFHVSDIKVTPNTSFNGNNSDSLEHLEGKDMDEICAKENGFLYCIHGHKIPHFYDDNNNNYVPVKKLKCLSIKFFDRPPNDADKLAYNKQLEYEFEIYMKQVAIKFMHRNKFIFDEAYVQNTIIACKDLALQKPSTDNLKTKEIMNELKSCKSSTPNLCKDKISMSPPKENFNNDMNLVENAENHQMFNSSKFKKIEPPKEESPVNVTNDSLRKPNIMHRSVTNIKHASNNSLKASSRNGINELINYSNNSLQSKNSRNDLNNEDSSITYVEPLLGVEQEVTITHVNKSAFYVNLNDRHQLTHELLFVTNQLACNAKPVKPSLGSLVFAKYLGVWYRALVLEKTPNIVVQYIDYGNISTDPITELRQISEELISKPAEAIEVRLDTTVNIDFKEEMVIKLKFLEKIDAGNYVAKHIPEKGAAKDEDVTTRKCITEITARNTVLSIVRMLNDTSFIAFMFNEKCIDDINALDSMSADCFVDTNFRPNITDLIAVQRKPNCWARAIVMAVNSKPIRYKCALIDYGTIIETSEVCKLHSKYENLLICTCVVNIPREFISKFKNDETDINCEILKDEKIIIHVNNTLIPATGTRWDPHKTDILNTALSLKSKIKIGDIVKIINVDDAKLYLRSKDSFMTLTSLNEALRSHACSTLSLNPTENQLVLHRYENQLRRAIVKDITENVANLYYIDYVLEGVANLDKLYECKDEIRDFPDTVLEYDLSNFKMNENNAEIVNELRKLEKQKFDIVDKNGSMEFQFEKSKKLLSDHLKELISKNENVIMLSDMPKHEIKNGSYRLMCLWTSELDKGIVAFSAPQIPAESFEELSNSIQEFTKNPHTPYKPKLNEVCLALFEDTWYRAVVLEIKNDNYEVYYLDYGNFMSVHPKELRPISEKFITVPPVAIFCEIDGFKENVRKNPKYISNIKTICQEEAVVDLKVLKEIDCNKFLVTFNFNIDDSEDF